MMQAEIAVLRFGLGARPGDLAAAADPRAWLMAQLKGAVPRAGNTLLAPSEQIFAEFVTARDERQEMRRKAAAQSTAPDATAAAALNPVREAYLPHYRAQVLARAQSAAAHHATLRRTAVCTFGPITLRCRRIKGPSSASPVRSRTRRFART